VPRRRLVRHREAVRVAEVRVDKEAIGTWTERRLEGGLGVRYLAGDVEATSGEHPAGHRLA